MSFLQRSRQRQTSSRTTSNCTADSSGLSSSGLTESMSGDPPSFMMSGGGIPAWKYRVVPIPLNL
jgi:hypothetical protein